MVGVEQNLLSLMLPYISVTLTPDVFSLVVWRSMPIHRALVLRKKLSIPLGVSEARAASGVFDILLAKTVGAVRQITVERGRDPAQSRLLGFGGAGPMLGSLSCL